MNPLSILIIVILAGIILYSKVAEQPESSEKSSEHLTPEYIKGAYERKWMFTPNEKPAYFKLKEIADKHGLLLFAKVRLFDLVTPVKGHQKYKSNRWRIQAKHVDFVLCKSNLVAKYIIELDDGSHDQSERKDRDQFVDGVLAACGYKVLHTRYINEEEIENFIAE